VLKLLPKRDEPLNFAVNGLKMLADKGVDLSAGVLGLVLQGEQGADGLDLKTQLASVPDEDEAADVTVAVTATVASGSRQGWQEANLLVVTDCRHLEAGAPGNLADGTFVAHFWDLSLVPLVTRGCRI
jgi:hypothetical protein